LKVGYQEIKFYLEAIQLAQTGSTAGNPLPRWAVILAASLAACGFLGILIGIAIMNWKIKPRMQGYRRLKDDKISAPRYGTVAKPRHHQHGSRHPYYYSGMTSTSFSSDQLVQPQNVVHNYSKSESRRDDIFIQDTHSSSDIDSAESGEGGQTYPRT